MGWDNWNAFQCNVNESLLLNTARAMVNYGLRDLGYDYIVLDDCWSIGRNSTGYLVANPEKFPNGMKYIADKLHGMGMKFGMYSSAGIYTCGRYPGSLGYEQKDADLWASWDVDYLKSQPGAFNDMDMLEVGNGGQTDSEYVVHFSMWAINSSPLLIGTNVLTLSPANLAIYSNPAVIALNQDSSGSAAVRKWQYFVNPDETGEGEIALWTRSMENGDQVFALLNAGNLSMTMNTTLYDIFLDAATAGAYQAPPELSESWDVYDLWANRMSDEEAGSIINGTASSIGADSNSTTRYNATATSYADGLTNNNTALYGSKVGTIGPGSQSRFSAIIDRHSVGLYRIRQASTTKRKRDEL
ncbi:MAG: hypothetical protein Q9165_006043 [Trypethelium subeluteriae]